MREYRLWNLDSSFKLLDAFICSVQVLGRCLWKQGFITWLLFLQESRRKKKQIDVVHTTVIFGGDSGEGVSDSLQQNEQPHRR